MKNSRWAALILTSAVWFGGVGMAAAQYSTPNPYNRPRVSPYINLLRGGSSPGINYYGIVRPEVRAQENFFRLQQQTQLNQQAITGLQGAAEGTFVTGHPVGFMTERSYFMTTGVPGQAGFSSGIGAAGTGAGGTPRAGAAAARGATAPAPSRSGGR